ncbi:TetR/AcrR family transcriptional regulator [Oceanirhabdus sp. W0125-5]|uniref:TetR/AcrR family transcriptional regulator n=1 Tax=Oceanirhabdus sp. W0125-5 TaxID=2999116 RepID=UPI0022F30DC5|nr:TetR/AcrR family transcriptional regulator [Oceanirhabdus sp. W0125-5]WBW96896.1 TetR/AcrR family transcriptional regulator [Oceanirhabdus sp. W0125-5]
MPKIIKNLDEKIYKSALNLFYKLGYDKVEMKAISKDVGIAVGTLYNYFPNKKTLYRKILTDSWNSTFEKVDKICGSDAIGKEKIKKVLIMIYKDVIDRKGLGRELFKGTDEEGIVFTKLKERVLDKVINIINSCDEINKETKEFNERISMTLIFNGFLLHDQKSEEHEKNIEFIEFMVDKMLF